MPSETPTILILVGITGDLSKRKLLPAIENLKNKKLLPEKFKLVGVTRRDVPDLFTMDLENIDDYEHLKKHLEDIETEWGVKAQRLFYLSVAQVVSLPIIKKLDESGLLHVQETKLLLEKPFSLDIPVDVADQVYHVDHYLQKNSVRELLHTQLSLEDVLRIEVVASESIGIEGRESFYEQTGALRDMVQSHLLEVAAALVSPSDRTAALKEFVLTEDIHRGQYSGYKDQVKNPESIVETKATITVLYKHLCITLKTGKKLDKKTSEISIFYIDGTVETISLNDVENAYEHVLLDAITGEKKFFVSTEEIAETFRITMPILERWGKGGDDMEVYS